MASPKFLLIVASSGRMLAEAAWNAGLKTIVVDLFGDTDTGKFSELVLQIDSLAVEVIALKIPFLLESYSIEGLIYGSGLEYYPETLVYLAERLEILGNTPEVFFKLLDKRIFFKCLDTLVIPYPEVAFVPPERVSGWLVKSMRGSGGEGIRHYDESVELKPFDYWQRYQQGEPYSVLFNADGLRFAIIGFNQQWTTCLENHQSFVFSGISNYHNLDQNAQSEVMRWVEALVPACVLKGLNSLDFIEFEGQLKLLEINPRPSASMQLYGAELLLAHIHACQGKSVNCQKKRNGYSAYQIIYAEWSVTIPEILVWPAECRDLPKSGSIINRGQPICSIIAADDSADRLTAKLSEIQYNLLQQLHDGS